MTSIALSGARQLTLYRRMVLIRKAEEQLASDFKAGRLPGPVHLYIGQEAVAVGVCGHLGDADYMTSTHRGHGHYLAKGGDPRAMFAEVYGKATGVCGGMGGSMHVADFAHGILGANGIVGGGIALATGAALAAQLDRKNGVAVAFFGDGAAAQGVLAETLNIAALWRLPLILCCENNGYSEFSPSAAVNAGRIADRAAPFGVPALVARGNDVLDVYRAAEAAIDRARGGGGATLIEVETYRFHGHVEGEKAFLKEDYRSEAEILQRRQGDPLQSFRAHLISAGIGSEDDLSRIEQEVGDGIAEIAESAFADPAPSPEVLERFLLRAEDAA